MRTRACALRHRSKELALFEDQVLRIVAGGRTGALAVLNPEARTFDWCGGATAASEVPSAVTQNGRPETGAVAGFGATLWQQSGTETD